VGLLELLGSCRAEIAGSRHWVGAERATEALAQGNAFVPLIRPA